jgi:hypothetical protein
MLRNLAKGVLYVAIAAYLCNRAGVAVAVCAGDCNSNGTVSAAELTKSISIVNLCDGAASGCAAIPGTDKQCTNADRDGNGTITAGDVTFIISSIINYPSGCAPEPPTPTPTVTPTTGLPTPTPTTATGPPLGDRAFSLGPGSGFFSSLAAGIKAGVPMGTLMLHAGGMDASGRATVTLANPGVVIRTDVSLGGLTLCTKLESCTGTLYCNGGANIDVLNSLDSLASGLTCVQDGTHACPAPPTPAVCCSNACEGIGVGSGNQPVQTSPPPIPTPGKDNGPGSMLIICMQRSATVEPIGDCAGADFESAAVSEQYYTTGIDTAQVTNHCPGSGAPANKVPKLARLGTAFDCANWTSEDGVGVLGFTIPSEEGSATITGDGANAGLWSDK